MTERSRDIAVARAHRSIRVLAEGEGPYDGELVTRGSGRAVRVDAARLRGWGGWRYAGAEHVVAPLDIALRDGGQDVLLPWCVSAVRTHVARAAEDGGIAHGEAVTLAVSVLRGVLELHGRGGEPDPRSSRHQDAADVEAEPHGSWWLTDEARPVFAIDAADIDGTRESPRDTGERLLRDLEARIEDRALRRVLFRLAEALRDPRRLRAEAVRWEGELLDIAAPRPLRMAGEEVPAPGDERVTRDERGPSETKERWRKPLPGSEGLSRRRERRTVAWPGSRRTGAERDREPDARVGWIASLGLRRRLTTVGRALPSTWRRDHRPAGLRGRAEALVPSRRRTHARRPLSGAERATARKRWRGPALVAASAAAVIAVAGALWPSGTGAADAADRAPATSPTLAGEPLPSPSSSPGPTVDSDAEPSTAEGTPTPGSSVQSEPSHAGEELIRAALECQTEPQPSCSDVWDGGASVSKVVRTTGGSAVLIEDYGDIAAIRNGSGDGAQMVVIIRRDAEWRIRDVYDIANPPFEGTGVP